MQVLKITATGLIRTGSTFVEGATLVAGSAAATLTLNDSLDGTGDDKGGVKTATATSQDANMFGAQCGTGIYATLTGTGAVAYMYIG